MSLKNALYIVSIPIGNPDDITLRAIKVLTEVDILVCEEFRNGSRLMRQLGIKDKQIITTNEHNESQQIDTLLIELAQGKSLALVSDCGTPLFSDPGHRLVEDGVVGKIGVAEAAAGEVFLDAVALAQHSAHRQHYLVVVKHK